MFLSLPTISGSGEYTRLRDYRNYDIAAQDTSIIQKVDIEAGDTQPFLFTPEPATTSLACPDCQRAEDAASIFCSDCGAFLSVFLAL